MRKFLLFFLLCVSLSVCTYAQGSASSHKKSKSGQKSAKSKDMDKNMEQLRMMLREFKRANG
jgi:hypothetical protein